MGGGRGAIVPPRDLELPYIYPSPPPEFWTFSCCYVKLAPPGKNYVYGPGEDDEDNSDEADDKDYEDD